jgi:NTP pyrophosphatase (non-canonical NTP hydrolase)
MSIPHPVTFEYFSEINRKRCEVDFKHKLDDWSLSDWAVAMSGEAGELCNIIKKLNRVRDGIGEFNRGVTEKELRSELANEIGDVFAYLDLVAQRAGLQIYDDCIRPKFNVVSERVGSAQHAPNVMRLR